jgi:hypothetical protein
MRIATTSSHRTVAPLGPVTVALIVTFAQAGRGRNPRRNHMLP